MERERRLKVIVTFPNTTSALAMETSCRRDGMPGRIIPVPNRISAGCGFSWCADAEDRPRIEEYLQAEKLVFSAVHLLEM